MPQSPASVRQVGVGVIGVGVMGENHAQAYSRHPLANLAAVCDVDGDRANAIAAQCGGEAYTDAAQLLARDDVEAVSICTPDHLHVEPTLAALDAGKHVLLEKPIATALADADTIIAAVKRASTKFMVGFIVRFDPKYAKIKEMLETGELGELESLFARRQNSLAAQDVLKGRVSVLSFLGVHDFDIMCWLADSRPVRVFTESVFGVLKSRGFDVEDQTFTLVRFENGVAACTDIGWALPTTHPRKADFKLQAIGTKGVADLDMVEQGLRTCLEGAGMQFPSFGHSIDAEVGHFIDCIREDREPLISAQDGRVALEVSLAAQQSAETHEVVTLPIA